MRKVVYVVIFIALFIFNSCSEKEKEVSPVDYYSTHVGKVLKSYGDGILAQMKTDYGPLYILRLKGSHYEMGFQYGYLAGDKIAGTWWNFMNYLGNEMGVTADFANTIFGQLLDLAWSQLSPYVPEEFYEEIRGIQDGADAAGFKNEYEIGDQKYYDNSVSISTLIKRIIAISNISDLLEEDPQGDMAMVLSTGFSVKAMDFYGITPQLSPSVKAWSHMVKEMGIKRLSLHGLLGHCSFFAAWNFRTQGGHLIASRNLDWNSNTGIANFKALTVWMPDGEIPHVTIGYIGFLGALAGISKAGITVSEVGSSSVFERLKGEPWVLKFREILGKAHNLDEALKYVVNEVDDGFNRPPTIGYNWLITYGDPAHDGARAEAMNVENNGVFIGVYRRRHNCDVETTLYQFDKEGRKAKVITHMEDPWLVNYEKDAMEIMLKDKNDQSSYPPYPYSLTDTPVKDIIALPKPIIDTSAGYRFSPDGIERVVGKELACAVYRGDEMMMHGLRMWQNACHGPWDYEPENHFYQDLERKMLEGGSYRKRYLRMYRTILAYQNGEKLVVTDDVTGEQIEIAPDNKGYLKPIDLSAGTRIASWAAMRGDIFSVVYDATALKIMVAFEKSEDGQWIRASNNPYKYVDLNDLFYMK